MAIQFNNIDAVLKQLAGSGAFLTTGKGNNSNVMTVGWGFVGVMWYRRVVIVPVRESRYTKRLLDENKEFCVSNLLTAVRIRDATAINSTPRDLKLSPLRSSAHRLSTAVQNTMSVNFCVNCRSIKVCSPTK